MWAGWEPPWEWGGTGRRWLAEWVGFERAVWEGDLLFSVGRWCLSEGGKDECLIKVAIPYVLVEN